MSTAAPVSNKPIKSEERTSVPLDSLFDDLNAEAGTPNIKEDAKKAAPGVKKAGNWDADDAKSIQHPTALPKQVCWADCAIASKSKDSSARSTPKPSINKVRSPLSKAFPTSKPMADKPEILKCTHCKRAVSKHVMPKHIEGCLNKKQEKQRKKKEAKDARDAAARKEKNAGAADSDDEEEAGEGKKTANKDSNLGASKKRKATDGDNLEEEKAGGPAKKKKKTDNAKNAKPPRPKAPVDVEKQCGVELPQGGQCARSLTCKSHSMGAKRAVPGRSAPYDKLLMEYQRKNQAKLQKAQFDAAQPREEDEVPSGPVDSEEERDSVMGAIARTWGGRPIWNPTPVPLRSKYQHNRIKGMLQSALGNRSGGSGLFGGGGGGGGGFFGSASASAPAPPAVDENGMVHARRGSVVPGARSMMPGSRKASVASAVGA